MPVLEDVEHTIEKPFKGHGDKTRYLVVIGTFVLVIIGFLTLKRMRAGNEAAPTTISALNPNTGQPGFMAGGTGLGTVGSDFSSLQSTLNDLAASESALVTAITAPPAGTGSQGLPPLTPISGEKLLGGGYTDPTGYEHQAIQTADGAWQYVSSPAQLSNLRLGGATLGFQSAPGVFTEVPDPSKLISGTPIYQKLPYAPAPAKTA